LISSDRHLADVASRGVGGAPNRAVDADSHSSTKYLHTTGDKEEKSEELKFDFLGLYRPSMILGNSKSPLHSVLS
jgi:hypothetical protein